MKPTLLSLAIVLILFLAISCAPSKMFVRTTPENETHISKTEHIGIINDVCLQIDPLFKRDYVLLDDSKVAATFMASEAKNYIEQKGYVINFMESPFVGCFLPHEMTFRLSDERGGEIRMVNPPFYSDESDTLEDEYLNSMLCILNEVYYTMTNNYTPVFSSKPELKECLKTIADHTGQDKILFMVGNGSIVPVGKSILQGVTIGLLTAVISFGMFTYYFYDVSYLDSYIMLLDLDTGEVLWTNSMKLSESDPREEAFYAKSWAENLLYYFPVREGVVLDK